MAVIPPHVRFPTAGFAIQPQGYAKLVNRAILRCPFNGLATLSALNIV